MRKPIHLYKTYFRNLSYVCIKSSTWIYDYVPNSIKITLFIFDNLCICIIFFYIILYLKYYINFNIFMYLFT